MSRRKIISCYFLRILGEGEHGLGCCNCGSRFGYSFGERTKLVSAYRKLT